MKVLVCGGRDYDKKEFAFHVLDRAHVHWNITQIIEGGARGVDSIANSWAKARGVDVLTFPADWNKHGKAAGPIRNKQMLEEGKPDHVIAFPGGNGTKNMIKLAKDAGVPVFEIN